MAKLSKEERDALTIPDYWKWPTEDQAVLGIQLRRDDGTRVSIYHRTLSACYPGGGSYSPPAEVILAVVTAAGLNPWYHEAKALRERVAELEKQLEDYPYGRCDCGDERQMGWCSGGCDNDE